MQICMTCQILFSSEDNLHDMPNPVFCKKKKKKKKKKKIKTNVISWSPAELASVNHGAFWAKPVPALQDSTQKIPLLT